MIAIQINTDAILSDLGDLKDRYSEAIADGMADAGRQIVELFRRDWLSGRSNGLGLNIRTGNLYQSLRSLTEIRGGTINSDVFNRGAQYWEYHQNPRDGRPKYLYLEETFQEDGSRIYTSQIEQALQAVA